MSVPASAISTSFLTDSSSIGLYNRGPITAIYSQPTSCLATFTLNQENTKDLYVGHYGNSYIDLDCYPTGTIQAQKLVTGSSWDAYYYSPAICPDGWITATTFESIFPGVNTITVLSLESDTTAGLCCPFGYSYYGLGHQCTSTITQNQVLSYLFPTNNGAGGWVTGPLSTSTVASGSSVIGDGVPIWWQSSDLELLASASTMLPPQTTFQATTTVIDTPRVSPTASAPSNTSTATNGSQSASSGGLSIGAKVGIGVGIPVAVIAGLAIGFFLFRRRGGSRSQQANSHLGAGFDPKPENDPLYGPQPGLSHEIHTQPEAYHSRHELPEIGYR